MLFVLFVWRKDNCIILFISILISVWYLFVYLMCLTTTLLDSRFPGMSLYFPGNSRPVLFNKWRNFSEKSGLFEQLCFKNAIKREIFEKKIWPPSKKIFEDLPTKIFFRKFGLAIYVWNIFLYRINTTGISREIPGNKEAISGNRKSPGNCQL